jgi:hypothetical protein
MTVQSLPPPALVVRKAALALCILLGLLDGPAAFIEVPTSCQPWRYCTSSTRGLSNKLERVRRARAADTPGGLWHIGWSLIHRSS